MAVITVKAICFYSSLIVNHCLQLSQNASVLLPGISWKRINTTLPLLPIMEPLRSQKWAHVESCSYNRTL